jgi:4-amino-4-deoxy-L-arabinose transferase-like glycosyltransferase
MLARFERPAWIFGATFGVALLARLGAVVLTAIFAPYRIGGDATVYDELARSLLAGRGLEHAGHQSAIFGPTYPAFLAVAYAVSGGSVIAAQLLQALAGAAAAATAALLALALAGRLAAWGTGAILALYPPIVIWTVLLLSENIFIPLAIASLYLLVTASVQGDPVRFGAAGLVLGLCALARPEAAAFVPPAALAILAIHRRAGLGFAVAFVLASASPLGAWVVRNAVAVGTPTLTTESGSVLWLGYGPYAAEGHRDGYVFDAPQAFVVPDGLGEAGADAIYRQKVFARIAERPTLPLELMPVKALNMFRPVWAGSRPVTVLFIGGAWLALLTLAVIGGARGRMRAEVWYVYLFALTITSVHLLTIGEIRYRMSIEAVLSVPAGVGLSVVLARLSRRWHILAFTTP